MYGICYRSSKKVKRFGGTAVKCTEPLNSGDTVSVPQHKLNIVESLNCVISQTVGRTQRYGELLVTMAYRIYHLLHNY